MQKANDQARGEDQVLPGFRSRSAALSRPSRPVQDFVPGSYKVAALYVDPEGFYPGVACEVWDKRRDARLYNGPLPVVAHPPCQEWGRLRAFAKCRGELDCVAHAVDQVRQFGGVLEHPAGSLVWPVFGLPPPDSTMWPDGWGGVSYQIALGDYGFAAPKLTWLYAVRCPGNPLRAGFGGQRGRVASMSSDGSRHITPLDLVLILCQWAEGAVSMSGSSVSPGQSTKYRYSYPLAASGQSLTDETKGVQ